LANRLNSLSINEDPDMTKNFNAVILNEEDWYVAQCLEVDVASQGQTEDEAMANLNEALLLHFTLPVATVLPNIRHFELEIAA
jgi:predicted RNase H-like HicB family nuclease